MGDVSETTLPKGTFVESFRIAIRSKLYFIDELADSNPMYDECPSYCGTEEKKREDFCTNCPAKRQQDAFKEKLEEALEFELEGKWQEFGIGMLLRNINDVAEVSTTDPNKWTVSTARLVEILESEKAKKRRIEDFERMEELKASTARNNNG